MESQKPLLLHDPSRCRQCWNNLESIEGLLSCTEKSFPSQLLIFKKFYTPSLHSFIAIPLSVINFVISKSFFQNFDSIFIKTYAKFLWKIKILIKKFWVEEKKYIFKIT